MRTCAWGAAPEDACLNLLGQLEQSTTDSVAYKQHKFISQLWRLGTARSRPQPAHVLGKALFLGHSQHILTVPSHGGRREGALWGFFYKAWIPFPEAPPQFPTSKYYHLWALRFQHTHELNCSKACGIFWDQGLNLRPLHGSWVLNYWSIREVPEFLFLQWSKYRRKLSTLKW